MTSKPGALLVAACQFKGRPLPDSHEEKVQLPEKVHLGVLGFHRRLHTYKEQMAESAFLIPQQKPSKFRWFICTMCCLRALLKFDAVLYALFLYKG